MQHTSSPGLPSRMPSPGTSSSNVQGSFWTNRQPWCIVPGSTRSYLRVCENRINVVVWHRAYSVAVLSIEVCLSNAQFVFAACAAIVSRDSVSILGGIGTITFADVKMSRMCAEWTIGMDVWLPRSSASCTTCSSGVVLPGHISAYHIFSSPWTYLNMSTPSTEYVVIILMVY